MADGIAAVLQILSNDGPLTAVVPTDRIIGGVLPQGMTLPAISISEVSAVPLKMLKKGATRFVVSRIQATVHSPDQVQRHSIIKLVRNAGDHETPTVAGLTNVICVADSVGPDLVMPEAAIYQK
ncbi:MAG TPA: DUF3168 domain-containing protein, partial [Sphingobium sp.]|nr:DUF3168 domain-containing protein [Sphingobium sp.]